MVKIRTSGLIIGISAAALVGLSALAYSVGRASVGPNQVTSGPAELVVMASPSVEYGLADVTSLAADTPTATATATATAYVPTPTSTPAQTSTEIAPTGTSTALMSTPTLVPTSMPVSTPTAAIPSNYSLETLVIYYGYPSLVNDSNWDPVQAASAFSAFDVIVLGETLSNPEHADYRNTQQIISLLRSSAKQHEIFGYIDMWCKENAVENNVEVCLTPWKDAADFLGYISDWQKLGIDGIFYDRASFDYKEIDAVIMRDVVALTHERGLHVFLNTFTPDMTLANAGLQDGDAILIEPFHFTNGQLYMAPFSRSDELVRELIGEYNGLQLPETKGIRFYGVGTYNINDTDAVRAGQYIELAQSARAVGLTGIAFSDPYYSSMVEKKDFGNVLSIFPEVP